MLLPIIVRSQPGIRRDGTSFASDFYVDGQWIRFQRQLARKMAGYIAISHYLSEVSRGMITFVVDDFTYVFTGGANLLEYFYLDLDGNTSVINTRTPVDYVPNAQSQWQFDIILDASGLTPVNQIVAQVAPNLKNIANSENGQLFIGELIDRNSTGTPLEDISWALDSQYLSTSGGVLALHPYLVVFGNDGSLAWSAPSMPRWFNQGKFELTNPVINTVAVAGKGDKYVVIPPTNPFVVGELITLGSAVPDPYVYYGIVDIGLIGQITINLPKPTIALYPAGTSICQFFLYPLIRLASARGPGALYCEIAGDYTSYLPDGTYFSFAVGGQSNPYQVNNTFYSPYTDVTTVNVTTPIYEAQVVATPLWLLQPSEYVCNADIALGATRFSMNGVSAAAFPNGEYIGFGSPLEAIAANNLVPVQNSIAINVYVLTLSNPLQTTVPAGSAIYVQGTLATGAGNARIAAQKIVKGVALRGGPGNSPSALLWSTDALLRMSFVGGELVFQFDTISPSSSILSAASVIEFDGVYYWVGSDRFLMFNGTVRELPNDQNINWFFDNINRNWKNKVFGFKVPRFSEIWWCFPFGDATECTHAVIYNIRENCWYDTKLPNSGRCAGQFMANFGRPLLMGIDPLTNTNGTFYRVWQHEQGVDEVDGTNIYPIESYFETASFSLPAQSSGKLKSIRVAVIEPDFLQKGDMSVAIVGQANARSKSVVGQEVIFSEKATKQSDQIACFKEERRILSFRFRSNAIGGNFEMGKIIAQIEEADGTYLGAVNASA